MSKAADKELLLHALKGAMEEGAALCAGVALHLWNTYGTEGARAYLMKTLADAPAEVQVLVSTGIADEEARLTAASDAKGA